MGTYLTQTMAKYGIPDRTKEIRQRNAPDLSNYAGGMGAVRGIESKETALPKLPAPTQTIRAAKETLPQKVKRIGGSLLIGAGEGTGIPDLGEWIFRQSIKNEVKKGKIRPEVAAEQLRPSSDAEAMPMLGLKGTKGESAARTVGEFAGALLPIGGIQGGVAKALPKVPRLAQIGITGGLYEGGKSALEGEPLPKVAKSAATGAVLWPAMEAGLGLAAKGIKAGVGMLLPDVKPKTVEALKLPKAELPKVSLPEVGNPKRPVGAEPDIPAGQKERGFSENTRTDVNNPDVLRDSYTENPLTYEQLANPDTLAKAQAVFDQGFESARTQLGELASQMKPEAVPLAKMLSRRAAESGNIQGAREIISEVAERLTQAGQFSQAARILRDADPETFLLTIGKQLKRLNKEGAEIYGKKWADVDLTPEELNVIANIKRGDQASYEAAFEQIQARIANELPSSAMEKVNAWRHISMLLNPKTHIRNVAGNTIMMGMRRTAKQVSAVLQKVFLKPEERTQVFKISGEYQKAAEEFFEANKKDLLAGPNKYNENIRLNMPNKRVFGNNALESTRKLTYKLLELGDVPFFKNAYINRLASFAEARGIKDFSKLPQEAFDTALKEAEQATYKDASELASWLNKNKNPGAKASLGKKAAALGFEAALPFTKTPINIIKRGIQYSPMGILNGIGMWTSQKAAAAGIDELAKGLTGTAVMGLGYLLAKNGILTGKAAEDKDLREYDKNTGNSPFSILGKYTYDWMQPFSVPLSVGVEIYNALKENPLEAKKMEAVIGNNDENKLWQIASQASKGLIDALSASTDTVFNMSIMRGVSQLIANPQGFAEGLAQLPGNYATQFIPTLSGQIAGVVDPTVRQTYVPGNLPQTVKGTVLNKIPFASRKLQPKQTPFGEDVKRPEGLPTRVLSQFLSPGLISVDQGVDPKIDAELRRLNQQGLTKQFPTMVPNYIDGTKQYPKILLTPEEQTQYQKRTGQLTLENFNKVMNKPSYQNAKDKKDGVKLITADEARAEMLAKAIEDAKAQAKAEIVKSKGYKVK
jgi:hypothetical protein